ncbi:MAG TPA: ankyrin repeat domain-containing protein, partial [Bacteroidales bacterium]|nr:ankyrin repeat domain-containing protein [Bacteroidales bacterium]
MKYYKIVNTEGHNGLIYHEGINIDPLPFNPSGDCEPGGIYFAKEDILAFVNYGTELYEVEPIGDVYENPGKPKKYKAHEVNMKYIGKVIDNIEMLIKEGANIHIDDDFVLRWAAENGHHNIIKLLIKNGVDIHIYNDAALRWAAYNGHYDIVRLLLKHGANVHADNDAALRWAVENEHYKIVKLLLDNGANVHAN